MDEPTLQNLPHLVKYNSFAIIGLGAEFHFGDLPPYDKLTIAWWHSVSKLKENRALKTLSIPCKNPLTSSAPQ
jgi:hypothetical protein